MKNSKLLDGFLTDAGEVETTKVYNPYGSSNGDVEAVFNTMKDENLQTLKEAVNDIEDLITHRQSLSKHLLSKFQKIELDIGNELLELTKTRTERTEELIKAKSELKQKKIDVATAKITEMLNEWRDVADLKKELRDRIKEFKEEQTKNNMLDSIIE